jgi:hypothetical protein
MADRPGSFPAGRDLRESEAGTPLYRPLPDPYERPEIPSPMSDAARGASIPWERCSPCRSVPCSVARAACMPSPKGDANAVQSCASPWDCDPTGVPVSPPAIAPFGVEFEQVLTQWLARVGLQTADGIALDGKTLRGIHGEELPEVHLVAAVAHQSRIVLAQAPTTGKGHELAGVQPVLAALPGQLLEGRVITGDALLATHALCEPIVAHKGAFSSSSKPLVRPPTRRS